MVKDISLDSVQIVGPICIGKSKLAVEGSVNDLKGLAEYLVKNELPSKDSLSIRFKRGAVTSDGRLDLCKQNIGPLGAEFVADNIAKNTVIKHLLMGDNTLGDQGAESVAKIIKQHQSIETIYLGCNKIGESGVRVLGQAIIDNENINALWIKRNDLGEDGAKWVGQMLQQSKSLHTLDLISNHLNAVAIGSIVKGIQLNISSVLTTLLLDSNELGVDGARVVADAISPTKGAPIPVRILSLSNCGIGDNGASLICIAASTNTLITQLDLSSNNLTPESVNPIIEMLSNNKTLQILDIGHSLNTTIIGGQINTFGEEGLTNIIGCLKKSNNMSLEMLYVLMTANLLSESQRAIVREAIESDDTALCRVEGIIRMVGKDSIIFFKLLTTKHKKRKAFKRGEKFVDNDNNNNNNNNNEQPKIDPQAEIDKITKPIISVYRGEKNNKNNNQNNNNSSTTSTTSTISSNSNTLPSLTTNSNDNELENIFDNVPLKLQFKF